MQKVRHIAYRAADVEGMANFFVNALGICYDLSQCSGFVGSSIRNECSSLGY